MIVILNNNIVSEAVSDYVAYYVLPIWHVCINDVITRRLEVRGHSLSQSQGGASGLMFLMLIQSWGEPHW